MSEERFTISPDGKEITCHRCGKKSDHPKDVSSRFCPRCKVFHDDQAADERIRREIRDSLRSKLQGETLLGDYHPNNFKDGGATHPAARSSQPAAAMKPAIRFL